MASDMPSLQAGIFGSRLRGRGLPFVRADQLQSRQYRAAPEAASREAKAATVARTPAPDVRCHGRERRASLNPFRSYPLFFSSGVTLWPYVLTKCVKKLSLTIVYVSSSYKL